MQPCGGKGAGPRDPDCELGGQREARGQQGDQVSVQTRPERHGTVE